MGADNRLTRAYRIATTSPHPPAEVGPEPDCARLPQRRPPGVVSRLERAISSRLGSETARHDCFADY